MCENETSYTLLIFVLILGFLINPILPSDFNELKIDIGGWNAQLNDLNHDLTSVGVRVAHHIYGT